MVWNGRCGWTFLRPEGRAPLALAAWLRLRWLPPRFSSVLQPFKFLVRRADFTVDRMASLARCRVVTSHSFALNSIAQLGRAPERLRPAPPARPRVSLRLRSASAGRRELEFSGAPFVVHALRPGRSRSGGGARPPSPPASCRRHASACPRDRPARREIPLTATATVECGARSTKNVQPPSVPLAGSGGEDDRPPETAGSTNRASVLCAAHGIHEHRCKMSKPQAAGARHTAALRGKGARVVAGCDFLAASHLPPESSHGSGTRTQKMRMFLSSQRS